MMMVGAPAPPPYRSQTAQHGNHDNGGDQKARVRAYQFGPHLQQGHARNGTLALVPNNEETSIDLVRGLLLRAAYGDIIDYELVDCANIYLYLLPDGEEITQSDMLVNNDAIVVFYSQIPYMGPIMNHYVVSQHIADSRVGPPLTSNGWDLWERMRSEAEAFLDKVDSLVDPQSSQHPLNMNQWMFDLSTITTSPPTSNCASPGGIGSTTCDNGFVNSLYPLTLPSSELSQTQLFPMNNVNDARVSPSSPNQNINRGGLRIPNLRRNDMSDNQTEFTAESAATYFTDGIRKTQPEISNAGRILIDQKEIVEENPGRSSDRESSISGRLDQQVLQVQHIDEPSKSLDANESVDSKTKKSIFSPLNVSGVNDSILLRGVAGSKIISQTPISGPDFFDDQNGSVILSGSSDSQSSQKKSEKGVSSFQSPSGNPLDLASGDETNSLASHYPLHGRRATYDGVSPLNTDPIEQLERGTDFALSASLDTKCYARKSLSAVIGSAGTGMSAGSNISSNLGIIGRGRNSLQGSLIGRSLSSSPMGVSNGMLYNAMGSVAQVPQAGSRDPLSLTIAGRSNGRISGSKSRILGVLSDPQLFSGLPTSSGDRGNRGTGMSSLAVPPMNLNMNIGMMGSISGAGMGMEVNEMNTGNIPPNKRIPRRLSISGNIKLRRVVHKLVLINRFNKQASLMNVKAFNGGQAGTPSTNAIARAFVGGLVTTSRATKEGESKTKHSTEGVPATNTSNGLRKLLQSSKLTLTHNNNSRIRVPPDKSIHSTGTRGITAVFSKRNSNGDLNNPGAFTLNNGNFRQLRTTPATLQASHSNSSSRSKFSIRGSRRSTAFHTIDQYIRETSNIYTYTHRRTSYADEPIPRWIILPESPLRITWDMLVLGLVLFYCYSVPTKLGFDLGPSASEVTLDYFADSIFLLDIILNFMTTYQHDGVWVLDRRRIARAYLLGWFPIDFVSSIPFAWFLRKNETSDVGAVNKLLRMMRLFKLIKLLRLLKLFPKFIALVETSIKVDPSMLRFARSFLILMLTWHLMGSAYWFVSLVELNGTAPCPLPPDSSSYGEAPPPLCFVNNCLCPGFDEPIQLPETDPTWLDEQWDNEWVPNARLAALPFHRQYLAAVFWSVSTTTSIGKDIVPRSSLEHSFTIVMILLGVMVYAIVIGAASSAIANIDSGAAQRRQALDSVLKFLRARGVPAFFQKIIIDYYRHVWSSASAGASNDEILNELPTSLKTRLTMIMNRDLVEKFSGLQKLSADVYIRLVQRLQQQSYLPGEFICRKGDFGDCLFFLNRGKVDAVADNGKDLLDTYYPGEIFGEKSVLFLEKRECTLRAVHFVDVLVLSRADFTELYITAPEFIREVQRLDIARDLKRKEYENTPLKKKRNGMQTVSQRVDGLAKKLSFWWKTPFSSPGGSNSSEGSKADPKSNKGDEDDGSALNSENGNSSSSSTAAEGTAKHSSSTSSTSETDAPHHVTFGKSRITEYPPVTSSNTESVVKSDGKMSGDISLTWRPNPEVEVGENSKVKELKNHKTGKGNNNSIHPLTGRAAIANTGSDSSMATITTYAVGTVSNNGSIRSTEGTESIPSQNSDSMKTTATSQTNRKSGSKEGRNEELLLLQSSGVDRENTGNMKSNLHSEISSRRASVKDGKKSNLCSSNSSPQLTRIGDRNDPNAISRQNIFRSVAKIYDKKTLDVNQSNLQPTVSTTRYIQGLNSVSPLRTSPPGAREIDNSRQITSIRITSHGPTEVPLRTNSLPHIMTSSSRRIENGVEEANGTIKETPQELRDFDIFQSPISPRVKMSGFHRFSKSIRGFLSIDRMSRRRSNSALSPRVAALRTYTAPNINNKSCRRLSIPKTTGSGTFHIKPADADSSSDGLSVGCSRGHSDSRGNDHKSKVGNSQIDRSSSKDTNSSNTHSNQYTSRSGSKFLLKSRRRNCLESERMETNEIAEKQEISEIRVISVVPDDPLRIPDLSKVTPRGRHERPKQKGQLKRPQNMRGTLGSVFNYPYNSNKSINNSTSDENGGIYKVANDYANGEKLNNSNIDRNNSHTGVALCNPSDNTLPHRVTLVTVTPESTTIQVDTARDSARVNSQRGSHEQGRVLNQQSQERRSITDQTNNQNIVFGHSIYTSGENDATQSKRESSTRQEIKKGNTVRYLQSNIDNIQYSHISTGSITSMDGSITDSNDFFNNDTDRNNELPSLDDRRANAKFTNAGEISEEDDTFLLHMPKMHPMSANLTPRDTIAFQAHNNRLATLRNNLNPFVEDDIDISNLHADFTAVRVITARSDTSSKSNTNL